MLCTGTNVSESRSGSQTRRHARHQIDGAVQVTWKGPQGQPKRLLARWLDLSAEGGRLETDLPIPTRTSVSLHSDCYGPMGLASVRHCARRKAKYSIGVQFAVALALAGPGRKQCLDDAEVPPSLGEQMQ